MRSSRWATTAVRASPRCSGACTSRTSARRAGAATVDPVSFVAFDVLYLDGHSQLDAGYDERRALLEALHLSGDTFTTTESFRDVVGPGRARGDEAERPGGGRRQAARFAVPRRVAGIRTGSRSSRRRTQEVVIGGWTDGQGERRGSLGALLLGIPADAGLRYVGKVGTGFSADARRALLSDLAPLATSESPFLPTLPAAEHTAHFVRPELVGEVEFSEWTPAGRLRHPTWKGVRRDKAAADVVGRVTG